MRVDENEFQLLDRITDGRAHLSVVVGSASTDDLTDPVIRSPREIIESMNRARAGAECHFETKKRYSYEIHDSY